MKIPTRQADPLEETMENPDLPPLTQAATPSRAAAASARRGLRMTLALGALFVVLAAIGLRLAA